MNEKNTKGEVAPGPDYTLYLSPEFVETEAEFLKIKDKMVQMGNVKTFKSFIVSVPDAIDPNIVNRVIVCGMVFLNLSKGQSWVLRKIEKIHFRQSSRDKPATRLNSFMFEVTIVSWWLNAQPAIITS